MAENKTRPTGADVDAFLGAVLPQKRREDALVLRALMEMATGAPAELWGPSMIGFGRTRYKTPGGRTGDMFVVGFSPRKASLVIYGVIEGPAAQEVLPRLGAHTTGKSCLYIKTLQDIDLDVLKTLIAISLKRQQAS